jgi:hypothetical protein
VATQPTTITALRRLVEARRRARHIVRQAITAEALRQLRPAA